jgi:hypothetical protein
MSISHTPNKIVSPEPIPSTSITSSSSTSLTGTGIEIGIDTANNQQSISHETKLNNTIMTSNNHCTTDSECRNGMESSALRRYHRYHRIDATPTNDDDSERINEDRIRTQLNDAITEDTFMTLTIDEAIGAYN